MLSSIEKTGHSLIVWVLIADSKRASLYNCQKFIREIPLGGANKHHLSDPKIDYRLVSVPNGILKAESLKDYQIGHNLRGRSSSSSSPTHNTYEPGDIDEELNRRFLHEMAGILQKSYEQKDFDRLVIVAPEHVINQLKKTLVPDVQKAIVGELAKDLTHYQGVTLMAHLHSTLLEMNQA